ncbi:unnamed protein product [Meloidogyne enterolobii]|uniref:Uncharacterized protein n=1 Tax=Meloidogyne enterolobii TaxID=390850 RepID=A0ACB1B7B3_MELEN
MMFVNNNEFSNIPTPLQFNPINSQHRRQQQFASPTTFPLKYLNKNYQNYSSYFIPYLNGETKGKITVFKNVN